MVEGASRHRIEGRTQTVRELMADARFSIDVYQREYAWQARQVRELIDDLTGRFLDCYRDDQSPSDVHGCEHYFLGPLVTSEGQRGERLIVDGQQRLTTLTLPVVALGTGREDRYRLDGPRVEELVSDRLTAARPSGAVGDGHRVQVLNGNGVPRIGQRVAELLGDGGYRVVLSGNADRFDYERTRIILHAAGPGVLEVAEDVRRRLGVGEVERAGTPQSVVDLTIVVGADFPP